MIEFNISEKIEKGVMGLYPISTGSFNVRVSIPNNNPNSVTTIRLLKELFEEEITVHGKEEIVGENTVITFTTYQIEMMRDIQEQLIKLYFKESGAPLTDN